MFRIRDHSCTNPENKLGINLHVSMPGGNVSLIECDVGIFFFFCIQILYTAFFYKVIKVDFLVLQFLYLLFSYFESSVFHN